MKITVTQQHIDKGTALACNACPIALAVMDKYPKTKVNVQPFYFEILGTNKEVYGLPREARVFIKDFDHHKEVKPFSFETAIEVNREL